MHRICIDGLSNGGWLEYLNGFLRSYRLTPGKFGFHREVDLGWYLYYAGVFSSVDEATSAIETGRVAVNGEVCQDRFILVDVAPPPIIDVDRRRIRYGPRRTT